MRVRVWRNLRHDCWTVYNCDTRRTLGPEEFVLLRDCTFHVSKRGRKRSLKKRWDSRHAYVEGYLFGILELKQGLDMIMLRCVPRGVAYDAKGGVFMDHAGMVVSDATIVMCPTTSADQTLYAL